MPGGKVPRITFCILLFALIATGCDRLTTEAPANGDIFDAPFEELTPSELAAFIRGDQEFGRRFAANTGLGPIFNNVSCASCHSGDGRGHLDNSLLRIGSDADEYLQSYGGPQIQHRAISGAEPESVPPGVAISVRLPPPVFGVGLIESIPAAQILVRADPDDSDGDGISGRPNMVTSAVYVPPAEPGGSAGSVLGRFGRKAQTSSLLEQVVEAYHQDMGITSEFRPFENGNPLSTIPHEALDRVIDPEISSATVRAVVHYVRALAPPAPGAESAQRSEGRNQFTVIGCAKCHTPSMQTGPNVMAALANREVQLYSDLLLHDMGEALADNRPDKGASGREWRTAPLWGLRLVPDFLNGIGYYLHDGRARSVEEAILQHGGEALAARNAFSALAADAKRALLDFVESR
jgi:CxxC motif-containing protein (DUF1111 family)